MQTLASSQTKNDMKRSFYRMLCSVERLLIIKNQMVYSCIQSCLFNTKTTIENLKVGELQLEVYAPLGNFINRYLSNCFVEDCDFFL